MNTVKQILLQAYKQLSSANISTAHLDAELLLSHILQKSRAYILAHPEKILSTKQTNKYLELLNKRSKLWPLAYLTQNKNFYGRNFFVNEKVLIPRPETEILIDEAIKIAQQNKNLKNIIDIGTGSGSIIITLACELPKKLNLNFLAIDISQAALKIARRNVKQYAANKKIKFTLGDLAQPLLDKAYFKKYKNTSQPIEILIIANLPYLAPKEMHEPSIKQEPTIALLGGKDGLKYYKKLAQQLKLLQKQLPNLVIHLLLEIGENQTQAIKRIFHWVKTIEVKPDLAGHDRIVVITA